MVIHRTPLPGFDVPQARYPGNAQQATDAEIERAGAGSLPEFMNRRLQGVTATDVQGSPFQREITYRGQRLSPLLGAPQGLSLYLDGVRMNQPFGDVVNWELLPEAAIAGLSLVPGSNPLYGLNTLAGALVLTTKSGLTHAGTEAEFSLGSHGRGRMDFGHGRQWGQGWHGYVAGTLFREDGWRDESQGRFGNLFLKLGRQQADTDWTLSLLHGESRLRGNGLLNESLHAIDRRAIYTAPDITRAQDTLLSFQGSHALSVDSRLALQAWYRQGGRDASNGDVGEDWEEWLESCEDDASVPECSDPSAPGFVGPAAVANDSRSRQKEAGLGLQWTRRAGAHQFAAGAEVAGARIEHDQFTAPGSFDANRIFVPSSAVPEHETSLRGRTQRLSLFAADAIDLSPRTQLSLAARWDRTRVRNRLGQPAPLEEEAFTYSKLNPSAGLTHAWTDAATVFLAASQGTRVPTALELGCADEARPCVLPTGLQADPYLKQVVSRTYEAGVRWRAGGVSASAALFRTDNRDDIVFVRSGVSQAGFFVNVPRTRRQGVELSVQGRRPVLQWSAGYTYLRATYQSEGVLPGPLSTDENPNRFSPGTPVANLPRQVLKLAADWRALPRLTLGADMLAVGSRPVAGNEGGSQPALGRIAGHAVLDARVRWRIDDRWQLTLTVNNVFDRDYATAGVGNLDFFPAGRPVLPPGEPAPARFLAPGAPRTFGLALRYEWDR
ncbi:TonB-dependent receptor [Ramlibacter sp. USB13]|uniref:TonB-dependent receptor n=1 Tax=Ramlibacter cellulosilyticus TaxID=2764187 RepID=A0A923MV97_9BURK|nr:TonB-dependent receptor [Ramlibacter cellulosilyticus]MBC5784819.1 TonB-dependent receptor [Ramlibacter cellulosilyticus]